MTWTDFVLGMVGVGFVGMQSWTLIAVVNLKTTVAELTIRLEDLPCRGKNNAASTTKTNKCKI